LGLGGTELAQAQCDTIHWKLLRIGAHIRITVRNVWIAFSEAYPYASLFQAVVGDAGRDVLRGDPGNDELFGGPGRDRLLGETGNDKMDGQGGSDSGMGGPGRPDRCFSLGPRGACEIIDGGSPPKPPKPIPRPPLPGGPGRLARAAYLQFPAVR